MARNLVLLLSTVLSLGTAQAWAQGNCNCRPGRIFAGADRPYTARYSVSFDMSDASAIESAAYYHNDWFSNNEVPRGIDVVGPSFVGPVDVEIVRDGSLASGAEATLNGLGRGTIRVSPQLLGRGGMFFNHVKWLLTHEFGHVYGFANLTNGGCAFRDSVMRAPIPQSEGFPTSGMTCGDGITMQDRYRELVSPIIIDLDDDGIRLSDPREGALFDLKGTEILERWSWPIDDRDAFLALDRNGNGDIDSGAELFGDNTLLSTGARAAHGFEALADFDDNGDALIDQRDAIFSSLVLWLDSNRDGTSEPTELRRLTELGIKSISTEARESRRIDRWGNAFRYRARVRADRRPYRLAAVDVFLVRDQF
jgi:hypothetical protein